MSSTVPVIDVAPFLDGSPEDQLAVARKVGDAFENVGFAQIVGHGVSESLIQRTYDSARIFFDLPEDQKEDVLQPGRGVMRGWTGPAKESVASSITEGSRPDLKEKFDIGPVNVPADNAYFHGLQASGWFAPNLWPDRPAEFEEAWQAYYLEMSELARQLHRMFALGLDLPVDFFEPMIDNHGAVLRAVNYPDQPGEPLEGQLRAGEHTDYGGPTILRQENAPGGLQVRGRDGKWSDVPVLPGAFVINIGDLMAQWTNDKWMSTMHRVVNPDRDQAHQSRRLSLVFFHLPNYDALIECIPTCRGAGESAKYAPVRAAEHILGKFVKAATGSESK